MPRCPARFVLARLLVLACLLGLPQRGWTAEPAARRAQFVYVLRVLPPYQDQKNWTDKETAVVGWHFERLAQATARGQVILAGRTTETLERTFGLVVFEAEDEAAARQFMESDPAVAAGIMSATLHPYAVALLRKP
jgi:uncharacterized protein YciI